MDVVRRKNTLSSIIPQAATVSIHIAANKADSTKGEPWLAIESNGLVQPTMADMELALRRADSGV